MTEWTGLLTAVAAVLAVFLGPVLAHMFSKRQVTATMREKWLSDLRQEVTDLLAEAEEMCPILIQHRGINPEFNERFRKLANHEVKVRLMLTSPKDPDHAALADCASRIVGLLSEDNTKPEEKSKRFIALKKETVDAGQRVLKEAWNQVLNT